MSLLEVRNASVAYGKVVALEDVSLHVDEGEIVTLVGANGAGKSTLMNSIVGLVPLRTGTIEFAGTVLGGRRTHEMVRLGLAYVPEGRGTLHQLSVRENLLLGAFGRRRDAAMTRDLATVLERFPALAQRMNQKAGTLSGGEQQMLVIGRALMSQPRLLLLDEPTLGLAPMIAAAILAIVADLSVRGLAVLLVEQNAHAALKLAKRAYVLETGRIVLAGEGLLGDRRVREAYLGELEPLGAPAD